MPKAIIWCDCFASGHLQTPARTLESCPGLSCSPLTCPKGPMVKLYELLGKWCSYKRSKLYEEPWSATPCFAEMWAPKLMRIKTKSSWCFCGSASAQKIRSVRGSSNHEELLWFLLAASRVQLNNSTNSWLLILRRFCSKNFKLLGVKKL